MTKGFTYKMFLALGFVQIQQMDFHDKSVADNHVFYIIKYILVQLPEVYI